MPREYLDPSDVIRLKAAAASPRDQLLIRLMFRLGCRVSEFLGITLGDIDFASNTITIVHLKARVSLTCSHCRAKLGLRHGYCPSCGTKTESIASSRSERRKMRALPVDDDSMSLITEHIQNHAQRLWECEGSSRIEKEQLQRLFRDSVRLVNNIEAVSGAIIIWKSEINGVYPTLETSPPRCGVCALTQN